MWPDNEDSDELSEPTRSGGASKRGTPASVMIRVTTAEPMDGLPAGMLDADELSEPRERITRDDLPTMIGERDMNRDEARKSLASRPQAIAKLLSALRALVGA